MKIDGAKCKKEKYFAFLLIFKIYKNKVHRGLRGSSLLNNSKRIYSFEFLSEACSLL